MSMQKALKVEFPPKMRGNGEVSAGEAVWAETMDYRSAVLINTSHSHPSFKSGDKVLLTQRLGEGKLGPFAWYEISGKV